MKTYLDWQFIENAIVELIHMPQPRILHRGLFNNKLDLVRVAKAHQRQGNLFVSLNRPQPQTVNNGFIPGNALKDDRIERITRLPFDFDPVRAEGFKGHPSTDAELAMAVSRRETLIKLLLNFSPAIPARAISGNGAHLLYRVALPNTPETNQAMRAIYRALRQQLSDDAVEFDSTVSNPARFFPLYDSIKRKGQASTTRPHRQTAINIPQGWQQISQRDFMSLADHCSRILTPAPVERSAGQPSNRPAGNGDYRTLDIAAWFRSHGLYLRPAGDGIKHFVVCPWSAEHSEAPTPNDTGTVIYDAGSNQWPSFRCLHSHCDHRRISEVMEQLGNADDYCSQQWERQS